MEGHSERWEEHERRIKYSISTRKTGFAGKFETDRGKNRKRRTPLVVMERRCVVGCCL